MSVKVLVEHYFEFLSLKGTCQARLSLHLSKCHSTCDPLKYKMINPILIPTLTVCVCIEINNTLEENTIVCAQWKRLDETVLSNTHKVNE